MHVNIERYMPGIEEALQFSCSVVSDSLALHGLQHARLPCPVTGIESPWTARRSNQSILKEISPEYSLEALMLKLKL